MIRVRQAARPAACRACGAEIPARELLASDGGRAWRCLRCTIAGLMRERRGVAPTAAPPALHQMATTRKD